MNRSNLDALTPTFVSLGPYVGSMRPPVLETRQPIPRSLESEGGQQHIESSRLRVVLDRGAAAGGINECVCVGSLVEFWEIVETIQFCWQGVRHGDPRRMAIFFQNLIQPSVQREINIRGELGQEPADRMLVPHRIKVPKGRL